MSRETTQICDRCGTRSTDNKSGFPNWCHITKDLAILLGLNPMQEGDLCPVCAASLRNWWGQ